MFTGIIKEIGVVRGLDRTGAMYRLAIQSKEIYKGVDIGGSVSVNGVCLTLVDKKKDALYFDVMEETIKRSGLIALKEKDPVNLEDALRADGVLGGHFVLAHVDCAGKIQGIQKNSEQSRMEIGIPEKFNRFVVEKGSVTLDGVSLTVGEVSAGAFSVYLIPHTLKSTTLGKKRQGDEVNIEFDIMGKYFARFKELEKPGNITESFLRENGF